jgi:hypothetical protein
MRDLIKALGGTTAVARALGEKPGVVNNWNERGIPWKWRPAVAELARKNKIELPEGFNPPHVEAA